MHSDTRFTKPQPPEEPKGGPANQLEEDYASLPPPDPRSPRVVFPSDLSLTRDQEDALCTHAMQRYRTLDQELGRTETQVSADGIPTFFQNEPGNPRYQRTFMAKRVLYKMMMENDYSWRPRLMPKSIFSKSNLVMPLCRRLWKQMSARAHNYFFGTDPWQSVNPVGVEDSELASKIQMLSNHKWKANENQDNLRRSIPIAFGVGECVEKITHTRKSIFFSTTETVALHPDGSIFVDSMGESIKPDDVWIPAPDGGYLLKRDGVTHTPDPTDLDFQPTVIEKQTVVYSGPQIRPIYFRDFLCPLDAPDVQSADCILEVMGYSANQLAADYMANPGEDLESLSRAIQAIANARANTDEAKPAASLRPEQGEFVAPTTDTEQMLVGEFYIRCDANQDGYSEDIMLVMDLVTGFPIFYNFVGNMTPDGLRPFRTVVPSPVIGRWFGQGTFEMFERHQEVIDLLINRRNVAQGEAGRVTFWNPKNTVEGESNPNLPLTWGRAYTPREGKKPEDILSVTYLDDNKFDKLTQEMETHIQFALNESGVQHANDANMGGMDTTKLATGIRNIEKSGQEMFGVYISELEGNLTNIADAFTTVLYANLDEEETFITLNGAVPVELTLAARDVEHLQFNVQVLLSRYKDEQVLASSSQAAILIKEYYALPPELQVRLKQFYIDMLTALQVKNSPTYVIPLPYSIPLADPGVNPQAPPQEGNVPQPNL